MKITKTKLKQIIMEEINEALPLGTPRSVKMASQGLGQPRRTPGAPEMEKIDVTDPKQVQSLYPYLDKRALEAEIAARGGAAADSPLWKLMTEPQLRLWLYQIGGPKAPEDY